MAYEIVISDWSADVGSSDLATNLGVGSSNLSGRAIDNTKAGEAIRRLFCVAIPPLHAVLSGGELEMEAVIAVDGAARFERHAQTGRASCRERVCQYVYIEVGGGTLKQNNMRSRWDET